jgi:F0F1-type ATP synthase membrane subunit c/vacuolar-type H+-ATPase subunit K
VCCRCITIRSHRHAGAAPRRHQRLGVCAVPHRRPDGGLGGPRAAALDVEIYDGDAIAPGADVRQRAQCAAQRSTRQQISIANHRWTLRISMLPTPASARSDKAQQIGAFGAALSVLLAWLTWLLARGRVRARGSSAAARWPRNSRKARPR